LGRLESGGRGYVNWMVMGFFDVFKWDDMRKNESFPWVFIWFWADIMWFFNRVEWDFNRVEWDFDRLECDLMGFCRGVMWFQWGFMGR
jgi:hypothetical protein